jgi:hypothetical protein
MIETYLLRRKIHAHLLLTLKQLGYIRFEKDL